MVVLICQYPYFEEISKLSSNHNKVNNLPSNKPVIISRLVLLLSLVFCFITGLSHATRYRHLSMGEYSQLAELIVIGDTYKDKNDQYIKITQVLKGDKSFRHKTISLTNKHLDRPNRITVAGSYRFPPIGEKNVAVLFSEDWQNRRVFDMFVYSYTDKDDIRNLKKMLAIIDVDNESRRLKKLMKFALQEPLSNSAMREQFVTEIAYLEDPKSFPVVLAYFEQVLMQHEKFLQKTSSSEAKSLAEEYLYDLMRAINETADLRAVPFFVSALDSNSEEVRNTAAHALYFTYPGAPGVTEAFIRFKDTQGVHEFAAQYLALRFDYKDSNPLAEHPLYIANKLIEQGKLQAARRIYHQQLVLNEATLSDKLFTAQALLNISNEGDKGYLVQHLLPEIDAMLMTEKNYFPNLDRVIDILTEIPNQARLPAVLRILELKINQNQKAFIKAVFVVATMGDSAIRQAESIILNRLSNIKYKGKIYGCCQDLHLLLALMWLNPDQVAQPHAEIFSDELYNHVRPFSSVSTVDDEAKFLATQFKDINDVNPIVKLWLIQRITFLKDEQALPLLLKLLTADSNHDYQIHKALMAIGGESTQNAMVSLFSDPRKWVRTTAIKVYAKLAGEKILPYLRKMITDENYGDKHEALTYLYYYGTPEDLPYLNINCDFWQTNNDLHDWACRARYGIWDRHDYDLNGPIKKVSGLPIMSRGK
ncbi:HEAT repeat domain-containing protein [Marinicella pacifica]|uniref:HEAT repeat domain-containing protein n=1 Tax=Marinicella pacifica TaxID=1171543 RepID=UPI00166EA47A|nr:HEAT repeat domain-containing protein [Marinicella pacifica]